MLLSGCFADGSTGDSPSPEILDPYYNPYNRTAASDGDYIYYCDERGINKWPIQGGETQLIVRGRIINFAIHGSYIYFLEQSNTSSYDRLYRTDKDGNARTKITTNHDNELVSIMEIRCLQDALYIRYMRSPLHIAEQEHLDGYFSADISADQEHLVFEKACGVPTSRGDFYIAENDRPSWEVSHYTLYRVYPDNPSRDFIAEGMSRPKYVITDSYVFYIKGNPENTSVWRCDLDGQNQIEFRNNIYSIFNYDAKWIYGFTEDEYAYRMNQDTGDLEVYLNWPSYKDKYLDAKDAYYFNVVGTYLLGSDEGKPIKMNVNGGCIEYAPFYS